MQAGQIWTLEEEFLLNVKTENVVARKNQNNELEVVEMLHRATETHVIYC